MYALRFSGFPYKQDWVHPGRGENFPETTKEAVVHRPSRYRPGSEYPNLILSIQDRQELSIVMKNIQIVW